MSENNSWKVKQIIGAVVDVEFSSDLPKIYDALKAEMPAGGILVLETQQHLGSQTVRTVAMGSTDGLKRGAAVTATGEPITVPVGPETLGRMFNVLGEALDEKEEVQAKKRYPIHRHAHPTIFQLNKNKKKKKKSKKKKTPPPPPPPPKSTRQKQKK